MINYQTFYNKYVNKNKENSASPRVFPFGNFALPRSSILHYVPLSQDDVGPPENYPLIAKSERKVPVHHVQQIATMEGKPVPLSTPIAESIRSYHNRNRKLIKTENFKNGTKDPITPFVINYSFASKKLRYPNNLKSQYFRSVNMLNTVIRTAAKLADETEFNQFMFVNMPRSLNKIGFLRMAANNMTAVHYQRFSNYDEVFLFHLWMWCGDQRSQSAFNYLNEEQMKKINIVFVSDGVYTIFNLGSWNSFRKNSIEDTGYPADVFQLRFVKMEMKFLEASKNNETIDEGESDESISEITSTLQDSQAEDDDRETVEDPRESKIASLDINNLDQYLQDRQNETGEDSLPDEDESSVSDKELFQDIPDTEKSVEGDIADSLTEAELEDEINSIDAMLTGNDERSIVGEYEDPVVVSDIPTDYAKASIEVLDAFAEQGTMSAATYKKKVEAAHKFETATVDLDGATVNLKDFITIDKKDLVIPERVEMKDPGAITDKRMLSAKLNYFDSHYIENVMKRDIALACTSMQKAGINISDIKKTTHEDAVTAYEMYTVKYTPIEGQTSSIRFKIPKLNENGVFKVNGREYVMRKQKGDIPIRKVNSSRVALTSYFGKVFIDLVERRQFNYGRWITNKIRSAALDKTNTLVKDSRSGNVFDSTAAVPSLYSILATEFKTFTVVSKDYEIFFYLDYQARQGRFGEQLVMETETSTKMTFIGLYTTAKEKWPVVIDSKNNLYVKRKDSLDELPALEEMIGLNPNDGPVEACELNVLGKTIPVGICLGYEMGLESLLKKLKISYREVMAGTRLNLTKEEHAIRFSDLAIVYNRKDAVASLILNGFNLYADQISEYSFYQFNNKPVYLNVLESKKITMRYLRKLDMLNKLFVDPITEKLLIEMKEPTTFRDLLVRSAQLLVTRDHPDEVDGSMQRIKGYERMVGAIYSQLSKSVETYYTKGNRSSAAIELHPEAIWMDILTDTAKAPYNELNPIQNLKHHEAVIFSGTGGRSAQSMVKRTRTYHKNDLGVISEATVDSGNVALNVYLSPDANFNNVYGISTPIDSNDPSQLNPTKIYSTSALTFAGVDGDD